MCRRGRNYLHIDANGDAESCAFIRYTDSIPTYAKSVCWTSCISSFMAYHDGQPINDNMMRPYPMLENPEKLWEIVKSSGVKSTDMQFPEMADHLCSKCDSYTACWAPKA